MDRPNIVLILADDLNYNSVGCFGCPVDDITPNMDKLAEEGMKFENMHVTIAVCQPSRQSMLTGLYPHRNGAPGFMPIEENVKTLTSVLHDSGYYNGILGKIEHCQPAEQFCWDYELEAMAAENGRGRSPYIYGKHTAQFINKAKEEGKPFFLMANSHDPHRPFAGSEDELTKFFGYNTYASRHYTPDEAWVPGFLPDLPDVRKELAQYYSSCRRFDEMVGEVLKSLDEAGERENTLVICMSDNGMAFPFAKANCYLNSTKTPFIARWPEKIKANSCDAGHVVGGVDFAPTILDLLGLQDKLETDGTSYLPLLLGKEQECMDTVFTQFNLTSMFNPYPMRCVQNKQYGYILNTWSDGETEYRNESQSGLTFNAMKAEGRHNAEVAKRADFFVHRCKEEFYDFSKDPDALNNLIDNPEYKEQVDEFRNLLREYMLKTEDPALEEIQNDAYYERIEQFKKETLERFRAQRRAALN